MDPSALRPAFHGRLTLLAAALAGLALAPGAAAQIVGADPAATPVSPASVSAPIPATGDPPPAPTSGLSPASAATVEALLTPATPGAPATVPPSPRMLDDPRIRSPYAGPPPLTRSVTEDFAVDTGDEPLWVLPPEAIPPGAGSGGGDPDLPNLDGGTLPAGGASWIDDRVRVPGYLDTPDSIVHAGRNPDELISGYLHEGLPWAFCGPRPPRLGPATVGAPIPEDTPVDVDTGGLAYRQDTDVLTLTGDVDVSRGGQRVRTSAATYDRKTGDILTSGTTLLDYPGLRIIGSHAEVNLEQERGRVYQARYRFSDAFNARGYADVADVLTPRLSQYSNLTYTACRPGLNAWSLRASKLELNQDTGRGVARHARLRLGPIPVLYSPWLDFPIDDRRKSGFLIPAMGFSSRSGFELMTPWYWNIAPQLDATFYPRYMSERGMMLGGELRYLTNNDEGMIQAEVIPRDAKYEGGDSRGAVHITETGTFFDRWVTSIDYSAVSDDQYLRDFGNSLDVTSVWTLPQRADLTYNGNGWYARSKLEAFQTVDPTLLPTSRPYGRLPQLVFDLRQTRLDSGLVVDLDAEYNYFDHNHLVNGSRLALVPSVSFPLRRSYGHLIPKLQVQLSQYALQDTGVGQAADPGHVIPTFDLDGRLVFERDIAWLKTPAIQTLEPRLYYLYTPYVDQSQTPVFDSSRLEFSYANMFRSNRFTGQDRIGDANQITAGLTSRTLDAGTGVELFRISVGQIYYFADRRVQIDTSLPATAWRSPYAAELAAQLTTNWFGRASVEWDPDEEVDPWGRRTFQLQYRSPDGTNILNLAYRFDQGTSAESRYEDTDLSFRFGLGDELGVVGRWLYSLEEGSTTEAFAGLEFGECCWKVRVLGRHADNGVDEEASNSVMLQLELAGLGAIGSPVNRFLEEEIYGYQVE